MFLLKEEATLKIAKKSHLSDGSFFDKYEHYIILIYNISVFL